MVHPEHHDLVDRLRRAHTFHQREGRLVDHRHEQSVRHEARVVPHLDRRLTELRGQVAGAPQRLRRRVDAAHHLDQAHQRHRIEKVHPHHAVRVSRRRGEARDRDGRRIRRHHRLRVHEAIQLFEHPDFSVLALDYCLDHELGRCNLRQLAGGVEPAQRRAARILRQGTPPNQAREPAAHAIHRQLDRGRRRVE